MALLKKFISLTLFAVTAFVSQAEAARPTNYPVQEFRFGIGNTNRNVKVVNTNAGSALNTVNVWTENSGKNERWYLNFISTGVYEIINAANDLALTNESGTLVMRANTGAANQHFKIEGVEKDSEGYQLYYKVVSNTDANSALTYAPNGDVFSMKTYSGSNGTAEYQKFKLNLDGLEGYAANALLGGKEKAGTIGGLLGKTVTVNNLSDFITAMDSKEPLTIVVSANMDLKNQGADKQRIRDYKTIVGSYNANTLYDTRLRTNDRNGKVGDNPSDNIVIRNIRFIAKTRANGGSGSATILLEIWSSRQIWVDHCTFDAEFNQDIKDEGKHIWINTPYDNYMDAKDRLRSPDYITLSYIHFKNRWWTVAYGTQNDEISRDRTTLMYNKWEKCARRTPQIGNGSGHIYSSYHTYEGTADISEQIIGGDGSNILSENLRFEGYKGKEIITGTPAYKDVGSYTADSPAGSLSALKITAKGTAISPKDYYGYTLINVNQNTNDVKTFCNKYSGVFNSYDKIKYITDSDMASFAATKHKIPFLKDIEVNVAVNIGSGKYVKNLNLLDPVNKAGWSIQESVKVDDLVYGDREIKWTTLPAQVTDKEFIRTATASKAMAGNQATFEAGVDITVYVILQKDVVANPGLPLWLEDWTSVAEASAVNPATGNPLNYYVYQKDFAEGTTVTLGTNGSAGGQNYTVAAAAQGDIPSSSSGTDQSSSSGTETDSSSSSEGSTPILNTPISISNSETLLYYNLRGESFGTTKPTKAGIYLIKQGSTVQKIVVR